MQRHDLYNVNHIWVQASVILNNTRMEVLNLMNYTSINYDEDLFLNAERHINDALDRNREFLNNTFKPSADLSLRVCLAIGHIAIYKDGLFAPYMCSNFSFNDDEFSCLNHEIARLYIAIRDEKLFEMIKDGTINCRMFHPECYNRLLKRSKPDFYESTKEHLKPLVIHSSIYRDSTLIRGTDGRLSKMDLEIVYDNQILLRGRSMREALQEYLTVAFEKYDKKLKDTDVVKVKLFVFGNEFNFNETVGYFKENFNTFVEWVERIVRRTKER